MTISSISDPSSLVSQLSTYSTSNRQSDADATGTSSVNSGGPPPPPGGGLMGAIMDALSQIEVGTSATSDSASSTSTASDSSNSSTSSTTSDSDVQKPLQTFMQSLFAAMHAQRAGSSFHSNAADTDSGSSVTSVMGSGSRPNPASDLQSLIQELSASSDQSPSASTSATSSTTTGLSNFLSTLASKMSYESTIGNLVSTHA